jgi:hypothetical protein
VVAVTDSVQNIVEELAAEPNVHPFGASYIAQRAGIAVPEAYQQLEALAERHDLDRHFELISPMTGRSLQEFRLGDKVPLGDTYEPDREDEEPFVVTDSDILISFAPTARLQVRVGGGTQKKKQPTHQREGSSPEFQGLRAQLQATLAATQRALREVSSKIRSEAHRRLTSSTPGGR